MYKIGKICRAARSVSEMTMVRGVLYDHHKVFNKFTHDKVSLNCHQVLIDRKTLINFSLRLFRSGGRGTSVGRRCPGRAAGGASSAAAAPGTPGTPGVQDAQVPGAMVL